MTFHRGYAVLALALAVTYHLVPSGVPRDVLYQVCGLACVAAVVAGVLRWRPQERAAWWLLAAGQLMFTVADAMLLVDSAVLGVEVFPGPADVVYLAAYPVLALGLLRLVRLRVRTVDLASLLDSAVLTVAVGLVAWVTLAHPLLSSDEPLLGRLVSAAYPMADILLLALLTLLVMTPGARTASFRLLCASMALLLAADAVYAVQSAADSYTGGVADTAWIAAYALAGVAALHPSMVALSARAGAAGDAEAAAPVTRLTGRRLLLLAAAVTLAPLTLAVQHALHRSLDVWAVVGSSLLLFALVVARLATLVKKVVSAAAQRDALQGDLAHAASHDQLTQLANRGQILDAIAAALHRAQRSSTPVGLLFVDLDRFKSVNDAHGHAVGDEVLREVAARLRSAVRGGDSVGRLGGDEFVVLVEQLGSDAALVEQAERIVDSLARPMETSAGQVTLGASIGVVVESDGGTDASSLLHDADTAAYRAKEAGRGRVEVFDEQLRSELAQVADVEAALRTALEHGELVLHYQPVVGMANRQVRGYEALLRWNRPGHGTVGPDAFIPVAERSSLVCDVDRWVLLEATRQLARWRRQGVVDAATTVAVNISGRHLADPSLLDDVAAALKGSGLPADALVLEMTETVLVDQPVAALHLERVRALGVKVSIDDFGTGYTSISQLRNLHADILKIDKSLVWSSSPGAAELVRLVVHAAHAFGLTVVAEGIEDTTQLRFLGEAGCDEGQGYLLGRPMPHIYGRASAGPAARDVAAERAAG